MRHTGARLLALLLVALTVLAAAATAEPEPKEVTADMDGDLLVQDEETLEAADALDGTEGAGSDSELDPRLTLEAMEKIFAKLSARCLLELHEKSSDLSKVSDRCRMEVASRVQRYLARLDKEDKGEAEEEEEEQKKKKKTDAKSQKKKGRKGRKQTRARREAVAAQRKQEEYQKALRVIVGFVVTFVAIIAGAVLVINRKLKAAGLYYSDPNAKATCCSN
uniref:Transmembrane protein n=1 Tax=Peronospora matthiolae TaxID=2874970 RepID=A0AAV1UJJ3_9STRA